LHSSIPGQLIGTHQVNLDTFDHHGSLPIQNASYYEKNSGLFFHDIQGLAQLLPASISIFPIEAVCEGVYFSGDLTWIIRIQHQESST